MRPGRVGARKIGENRGVMCGRYAITLPPDAIRAVFGYVEQPNFPPRYNIAPTQPVPLVRAARHDDGVARRHFVLARWGFLPGFVKDPKDFPLLINARAETLAEKPSFRNAFRRRRCLLPADAYYEWRREPAARGRGAKRPFLFRRRDGATMGFAGLYETWAGPNGEEVETVCIVTTTANGAVAAIHDRMPAILEPRDFGAWLDPDVDDPARVAHLLRPVADDVLAFHEIGPAVGSVANDDAGIQNPA